MHSKQYNHKNACARTKLLPRSRSWQNWCETPKCNNTSTPTNFKEEKKAEEKEFDPKQIAITLAPEMESKNPPEQEARPMDTDSQEEGKKAEEKNQKVKCMTHR